MKYNQDAQEMSSHIASRPVPPLAINASQLKHLMKGKYRIVPCSNLAQENGMKVISIEELSSSSNLQFVSLSQNESSSLEAMQPLQENQIGEESVASGQDRKCNLSHNNEKVKRTFKFELPMTRSKTAAASASCVPAKRVKTLNIFSEEDYQQHDEESDSNENPAESSDDGGLRNACSFCQKKYSAKRSWKHHERYCTQNPNAVREFPCEICSTVFGRKEALRRHVSKGSCLGPSNKVSRHFCTYENCNARFWHKTGLINHLKLIHNANLEPVQHHVFKNMEAFMSWKEEEEKTSLSYYSEQYGVKDGNVYFYCQQDGPLRNRNDPNSYKKRSGNRKGRIKTGAMCISMMKVKIKRDKTVAVEYHPGHNHEIDKSDLKHQPIPNTVNSFIKTQLAMGVSPSNLYKALQKDKFSQKCGSSDITRCDFINVKRLRELRRRMSAEKKLAPDDTTAVKMFVEFLQSEEFNPILLHKPKSSKLLIGPESEENICDDDVFMLALHSKEQSEYLQFACETILIVDVTYDTDLYSAQLINLIGVDELNRCYPLAHLIANQIDGNVLNCFFNAIKERYPCLSINCVLTKNDPELISSLISCFGDSLCHIFCTWNFKLTLKKQLLVHVKNAESRDIMFRELCLIVDSPTETEFDELLSVFLETYRDSQSDFVNYFSENCLPTKIKWALCFRRFTYGNVDTMVHAESFHGLLRNLYLKRNPRNGIAALIDSLLEVGEDYFSQRRSVVNIEDTMAAIAIKHKRGMQIPNNHVKVIQVSGSMSWLIQSQSKENMNYHVVRSSRVCTWPDTCSFHCDGIDGCDRLCCHMYVCTCSDKTLLCKHVHKINTLFPVPAEFTDETLRQVENSQNEIVLPLAEDSQDTQDELVLSVPEDVQETHPFTVADCLADVEVVISIPEDTLDVASGSIDDITDYGDIVVISVPGDSCDNVSTPDDSDQIVYFIEEEDGVEESSQIEHQENLSLSYQNEELPVKIKQENVNESDREKREELQNFLLELQSNIQSIDVINTLYPFLRDGLHKLATQCRSVMTSTDGNSVSLSP